VARASVCLTAIAAGTDSGVVVYDSSTGEQVGAIKQHPPSSSGRTDISARPQLT
jgi:hypothetical protein